MWPLVVTDGLHTMKPEVGPVHYGQMHSRRWHSPGICHKCVCLSFVHRQNLLLSLKTTEHHSTLQSTLTRHQSSRALQCHGVSGSLAEGSWFPMVLGDTASILTCVCTTQPSGTWSTTVGMFHKPLLIAATHHWYIVTNMCSNPSTCPSTFLQAYNAMPFKWPNCNNRCKMLGTIYHRMTFGTFMTICMQEYKPALSPGGYTVYWCDCLGTPCCDMCFIWSEFVII